MTVWNEWMRLRSATQRAIRAETAATRLAARVHLAEDTIAAYDSRLAALQAANEDWERRCAACQRAKELARQAEDPWEFVADGWLE